MNFVAVSFGCGLGLVDLTCCLVCFMWPFAVVMVCGGCMRRDSGVSPGKPWTYPFWSASWSVRRDGENRVAWAKATICADEAPWAAWLALCC